jgi:hypothetical protein
MLVFSTPLVNLWGGGGLGIGLCREHRQELYTVHLTRFRTYKMAYLPPQTKTREGSGPQTDKQLCRQIPLLVNF